MYNTSEQTIYYDPEIGRFISPDSTKYLAPESIHGLNLYAYCLNNPVMYTDPSGHSITLAIVGFVSSMVISGLISGGYSAAVASEYGSDVLASFGGGFVTGALSALAVGVGMGITGTAGVLACIGLGFVAGFTGNTVTQGISSIRSTGSFSEYNLGSAVASGVINTFATALTMGGMTISLADSFSPAVTGNTFAQRFINFMSYDTYNALLSVYWGFFTGIIDPIISVVKEELMEN